MILDTKTEFSANLEELKYQQVNTRQQVGALKYLVGTRDSTTAVGESVLNCDKDQKLFEDTFAICSLGDVSRCWTAIKNERQGVSTAQDESDVQKHMIPASSACCADGQLCVHDTHVKNYPTGHKIDMCFTSAMFQPEQPVPMSEVVSFMEFKHRFDPSSRSDAAIQVHDRCSAILNIQEHPRKIFCAISDKHHIQFFLCDPEAYSPVPFVSTNLLPFLNNDQHPTLGFHLFYRMCKSSLDQLGHPQMPMCPLLNDHAVILRQRNPPKANVFTVTREGSKLVVKAYSQGHMLSQSTLEQEAHALGEFKKNSAPVPELLEFNQDLSYLLLSPFATTLKECMDYKFELLRAVASAGATFLQVARRLGMVHKDISPDNILVCNDGRVLINDLGSCHTAEPVKSLMGANLTYCCPYFALHFEPNGLKGPYNYTLRNDVRALFICLFYFSLVPSSRGKSRRVLPWDRCIAMQATKFATLKTTAWTYKVQKNALAFLQEIWEHVFANVKWDESLREEIFDVDLVLERLSKVEGPAGQV